MDISLQMRGLVLAEDYCPALVLYYLNDAGCTITSLMLEQSCIPRRRD